MFANTQVPYHNLCRGKVRYSHCLANTRLAEARWWRCVFSGVGWGAWQVGFSRLAPRMTMARTLKLYKLPDAPVSPRLRPIQVTSPQTHSGHVPSDPFRSRPLRPAFVLTVPSVPFS